MSCFLLQGDFDSLLNLLRWAWSGMQEIGSSGLMSLKPDAQLAAVQDVEKLSFVSVSCLKLLRTYICEVYPSGGEFLHRRHQGVVFFFFFFLPSQPLRFPVTFAIPIHVSFLETPFFVAVCFI